MSDDPNSDPAQGDAPPRYSSAPTGEVQLSALELEQARTRKITAGVLAIVLGCLGIHKFFLGYNGAGLIMLGVTIVVSFCLCVPGLGAYAMALVGLIEGIIYLSKPDDQFYRAYMAGRRSWF